MKMERTLHVVAGTVRLEIKVETKDLRSHSILASKLQLRKIIEDHLTEFVCKVEAADHVLVED